MMVMTIMMTVIDIYNENTNNHYHHGHSCAGELVQVVSLCIIQTRAGIKHLKVITLSTRNIIIIVIFSTAGALVVITV